MRYDRIVQFIASRPWAMHPDALGLMCEVVAAKAAGTGPVAEFEKNHGGTPYFAEDFGAAIPGQSASAVARREGRVAVLPIRGTILNRMSGMDAMSGGTGLEQLAKTFTGLVQDNGVKAIVLDIDSLGGSVEGLPEMGAMIRDARGAKPIAGQVNVRAASAAYWLAAQASDLAVAPSGDVGSIGVITVHQDMSAALEKAGIATTIIGSSPYKGEGNPYQPLSEEARAAIASDVAAFGEMFHDAVAEGRGVKTSTVRADFGQGRMVLAAEAVKRGMADRVATLEQTLNRYGASMYGRSGRMAAQDAYQDRRRARRSFLRRESLRAN